MPTRPKRTLEVCVASVDDAVAAEGGGADRLELNAALELGGLTPTAGVLEEVLAAVRIPVIAMVRPRAAGFRYSASDRRVMLRDAERLLEFGAAGLASGALTNDGRVDLPFWEELVRLAGRRDVVFHRAIDVIDDPVIALEQLIVCGTTRVLTSGGAATAVSGRRTIARLGEVASGRIQLLPGAGISAANVVDLIRDTGCDQIHGSFRDTVEDPAGVVAEGRYPRTSTRRVAAVRQAMDGT